MNDSFTTKKVGGEGTVGEIIFKARRSSGETIERIAEKLQIQKKYLLSLEEGEFENLPADVYTKGFLKSYANYLKLDPDKITSLYLKEKGIVDKVKQTRGEDKNEKSAGFKKQRVIVTPKLLKFGAIFLIIFSLFFYLWYQISGLSSAPKLEVMEPATDKTISDDTITIIGVTKPGADVTINGQSVFVDQSGSFKESVGLQEGLNTLRIVATNKLDKQNVVERKVMVERTEGVVRRDVNEQNNKLELTVSIKDTATWISVEEDGEEAYEGTMLPDSSQRFSADREIILSSGNDSTTYVIFNGKDVGNLGDTGEAIRDMKFTEDISL